MNDVALSEYLTGDKSRPFPNKEAADRNRQRLLDANPWMAEEALYKTASGVVFGNASSRSKVAKLLKLVDMAGAAIAEVAPCRRGCSHCCHIPALVFSSEAERIGQFVGRAPTILLPRAPEQLQQLGDRFTGEACPFLKDGECSVYEVRPFCCRQHHSLDDTAAQCDLSIPSHESSVPIYGGLRLIELYHAQLLYEKEVVGDIREFFPKNPA